MGVSNEAVHETPAPHTDGAASSNGRDPVQRDDAGGEERLDPVPRDALEWNVEYGLRKARSLLPRKVAPGVFDAYKPAARVVVEHLERCGIRCFRKPPAPLAQSGEGPAGRRGGSTDRAEAERRRGSAEPQR